MPTHHEQRFMPYDSMAMFHLVGDVAKYPEFLPWVTAARLRSDISDGPIRVLEADLVVSFKVFRERFGSRVTSDQQALRIDVEYLDGPFQRLDNYWQFQTCPDGCQVEFFIDFEFRSILLQNTIGLIFNEAMQRIVSAFEQRAAALYSQHLSEGGE